MRHARLEVRRLGNKLTVAALKNDGGYFVHIKPDARWHGKQRLLIRNLKPGAPQVELNGHQIATLKRVLGVAERSCK